MIRALTGSALFIASFAVAAPIWALSIAAFVWAVVVVVHRHRRQEQQRAAVSRLPRQHKRHPAPFADHGGFWERETAPPAPGSRPEPAPAPLHRVA